MMDDDTLVTVTFTVTREYSYEEELPEVAKTLGVSQDRLKRIVDGDDKLDEVSDGAMKRLLRKADEVSEEVTFDDVIES